MSEESNKTILVVDDESEVRAVTVKLLKHKGYRVLEADSGPSAIETLKGGEVVDLLVLDVMMPGMDGFEVLDFIRRNGFPVIHVVMLTARRENQDVLKGYNRGAEFYVTKPFRNDTLMNVVEYLIGDLDDEQRADLEMRL